MATTRTTLSVGEVFPPPTGGITLLLTMKTPPAASLYIGYVVITRLATASSPIVAGTLVAGSTSRSGHVVLNMEGAAFDAIVNEARSFKLVLTYDSVTRLVSNLSVVVDAAA